jgi:hypothetical protein
VWFKDQAGSLALKLELNEGTLRISFRDAATGGSWGDGAWTREHSFGLTTQIAALFGDFNFGGRIRLGDGLLTTVAGLIKARIEIPHGAISATAGTYTELLRSILVDTAGAALTGQSFRLYAIASAASGGRTGTALAVNAIWSDSTELWSKSKASKPSLLVLANTESPGSGLTSELAVYWREPNGSATWAENAWVQIAKLSMPTTVAGVGRGVQLELRNARIAMTDPTADTDGTNPPVASAFENTLFAGSMLKGLALVEIVLGVAGIITSSPGFNVASVAIVGTIGSRKLEVTFATAFTGPWAFVAFQATHGAGHVAHNYNLFTRTTGTATGEIEIYSAATGTVVDAGAALTSGAFCVVAWGAQG